MTTEIKYIKKDGKVYRQETQEEEYNVDDIIQSYEDQLAALNKTKTDISKL